MRKTHCRTKIMERKLKNVKNETQTLFDLDYGKKHWKNGKWEMHTLGPGIWRENWKSWKMKINTVGSEIWRETPKNVKNEKQNLFDLEYGEKQWKWWKMRNAHCRTWNMVKKLKKFRKWKTHTVGPGKWRETFKNVKNEKNPLARKLNNEKNETQTLFDMEYREKHWKRWKMRNAHYRTWNMARKLKIMENEKHTL